jgi:bacteriocin-like protein
MKNIFRRVTLKQTDASITQPHFRELDERELQQVSGGSSCTPPPIPPRRPLPPQKHRQPLPVEPLQPNQVR